MITFNDIYEASRKERASDVLQSLPESFISDVAEYLKEKKDVASKNEEGFSDVIDKTKKQIENAMTLFKELMNRRKKKILDLILIASETGISKRDFDNMFDFEKKLFEELMKLIDISDKEINYTLNGNDNHVDNKSGFIKIIFNEDIDEFVNFDGKVIGPFKKDQTVEISETIAKILIEDKKAYPT